MGRKKPVILSNGKDFVTKGECTDYFKGILNSGMAVINESNQECFSDLIALYLNHPEFESKSGSISNIMHFEIKNSGQYNTPCFHAVHKDNSISDWSYKTAIDGTNESLFHSFVDGARYALEQIKYDFRDSNFTKKCERFLTTKESNRETLPREWVSEPQKHQYRSSLMEPIKTEFVAWYNSCLSNQN